MKSGSFKNNVTIKHEKNQKTVCLQMKSEQIRNNKKAHIVSKWGFYIDLITSHMGVCVCVCVCELDLASKDSQGLICYKTLTNQPTNQPFANSVGKIHIIYWVTIVGAIITNPAFIQVFQ